MKKLFYRLLITFGLVFSLLGVITPTTTLAFDPFNKTCEGGGTGQSSFCKNVNESKGENRISGKDGLGTRALQIIVYLTGAISVIMVIVGGFKYVISGGDSAGTKSAKDTILYALIGLAVAVMCQIIVSFVLSRI